MMDTTAADKADDEQDSSDENEERNGRLNQRIRAVNVEIVDNRWLQQHPCSNTQQQAATQLSHQTFRPAITTVLAHDSIICYSALGLYAIARPSVRLSHGWTVDQSKTVKVRIMQLSP